MTLAFLMRSEETGGERFPVSCLCPSLCEWKKETYAGVKASREIKL